ncbi:MAG: RNA polymerase sigma factor [Anaerolineae bacterium]|nr:RNA polymerase sigma factor [Anaerolineae bacterium]
MGQNVSDGALVRRAQDGDREAFRALYDRYFDKVYNRVKAKVPIQEVEDVTQEIFIAVARSLPRFEHRAKFNTWLYTIVSRQIADFYRRYYRRDEVSVESDEEGPVVNFNDAQIDNSVILQRALLSLPAHYQEIILLRFADGLPFAEIARVQGKSLEAVKSLYRRAIEAIREKVGQ